MLWLITIQLPEIGSLNGFIDKNMDASGYKMIYKPNGHDRSKCRLCFEVHHVINPFLQDLTHTVWPVLSPRTPLGHTRLHSQCGLERSFGTFVGKPNWIPIPVEKTQHGNCRIVRFYSKIVLSIGTTPRAIGLRWKA